MFVNGTSCIQLSSNFIFLPLFHWNLAIISCEEFMGVSDSSITDVCLLHTHTHTYIYIYIYNIYIYIYIWGCKSSVLIGTPCIYYQLMQKELSANSVTHMVSPRKPYNAANWRSCVMFWTKHCNSIASNVWKKVYFWIS